MEIKEPIKCGRCGGSPAMHMTSDDKYQLYCGVCGLESDQTAKIFEAIKSWNNKASKPDSFQQVAEDTIERFCHSCCNAFDARCESLYDCPIFSLILRYERLERGLDAN